MVGWETRYYLQHACHNIRSIIFVWELLQLFYLNWPSYRAESNSWKCLGLLTITSWSALSSLTVYSISFTILGMSFLVSHWQQWRFQCGRRVFDRFIAALSHCCAVSWLFEVDDRSISREVADCSLEASLVTALPSTRKNLLDMAKVLTSFPALAGPILSWSRRLSKHSQVFMGSRFIR